MAGRFLKKFSRAEIFLGAKGAFFPGAKNFLGGDIERCLGKGVNGFKRETGVFPLGGKRDG